MTTTITTPASTLQKHISSIRSGHFMNWLREEIHNGGRDILVGYSDDQDLNPLSRFIRIYTGTSEMVRLSYSSFTVEGTTYFLSPIFVSFVHNVIFDASISGQAITAWEMLQITDAFLSTKIPLVDLFTEGC